MPRFVKIPIGLGDDSFHREIYINPELILSIKSIGTGKFSQIKLVDGSMTAVPLDIDEVLSIIN